jgi:acetyltransferase
VAILKESGVPCYALPGEAARAMAALVDYHRIKTRTAGEVRTFTADRQKARDIIERAKADDRKMLAAQDVYTILEAYGIPTAAWRMAADADAAQKAAADIGYPVVLKADAESIVHKSDMGGVAVNLADADALQAAAADMQRKFDAPDLRFLVQKFLPGGTELILGAKAEEGLGHAVMFGLGGIFVEVMKDVVFNLTPVTTAEAEAMLTEIKGAPLLKGVRGQKGIDRKAAAELVCRLSQLLTDLPAIAEMDLNPTLAYPNGVFVVDARIGL